MTWIPPEHMSAEDREQLTELAQRYRDILAELRWQWEAEVKTGGWSVRWRQLVALGEAKGLLTRLTGKPEALRHPALRRMAGHQADTTPDTKRTP